MSLPFFSILRPLLAGGLTVFAFAPFGWWPLQIIALAWLCAPLLSEDSPRTAARSGWLFGMASITAGMVALGTIDASSSALRVVGSAMLCGMGIGFVMQTLLFVVQRFTEPRDIGVATSTVMLARLLGNAMGVAIVGSVFTNSLLSTVTRELPDFPTESLQGSAEEIARLGDDVRLTVQDAIADSLAMGFRSLVPFMLLGMVLVAFIPARMVRTHMRSTAPVALSPESTAHGL